MMRTRIFALWLFAVFLIMLLSFSVWAQTASFYGNPGTASAYRSNFQSYYRENVGTYWPILKDKESCVARQDILLQVAPIGCQPSVVRSDLLAEQNVPVFCQIDALKINPLISIDSIDNIRFSAKYPKEVVGTGFHPARAALRTYDKLLGSPLINNIGYVVVVLKKTPNEAEMPDTVSLNLTAKLIYDAENALGIGRAEFFLSEVSENEWKNERNRNSFWQGRFFIRLESADGDNARISIYQGERKISSLDVQRGEVSREFYLPGLYCQAGLQVAFDKFESAETSAVLRVDDDTIEVYKGSSFLNNKCSVADLRNESVKLRCGSKSFELKISDRGFAEGDIVSYNKEGRWEVVKVTEDKGKAVYDIKRIDANGEAGNIKGPELRHLSSDKLKENEYDGETEKYFEKAIESYRKVASEYPAERARELEEISVTYGETALKEAIELASVFGKERTKAGLVEEFLDLYPESEIAGHYVSELDRLYRTDGSLAGVRVELDGKTRNIRLVDIKKPLKTSSAEFSWGTNDRVRAELKKETEASSGKIIVESLDVDEARGSVTCSSKEEKGGTFRLKIGKEGERLCGRVLVLESVDMERVAKVRILPRINNIKGETNLTVNIGIEKRAIQLTPNKSKERIEELNETINKWEGVSNGLTKVIEPLKGACFATAGVLTVKNFLTGLSGEGIARQKVMKDYWTQECSDLRVGSKTYSTINECYLDNSGQINSDVAAVKAELEKTNSRIKEIERQYDKPVSGIGSIFGEKVVDRKKSVGDFVSKELKAKYGTNEISYNKGGQATVKSVNDLLSNANGYEEGEYNYDQVRDIKFNMDLANSADASPGMKEAAKKRLGEIAATIDGNKELNMEYKQALALKSQGYASPSRLSAQGQNVKYTDIVPISGVLVGKFSGNTEVTHSASFIIDATEFEGTTFKPGNYVAGLKKEQDGSFTIVKIIGPDNIDVDVAKYNGAFGIGGLRSHEQISYNNNYIEPEVKYYETEPFKGPSIVPFDKQRGWYAATKQTLPVFGGLGGFESSGKVASFWLCNVGENGRQQFFEGLGDDICQLVNLNTGQPLNPFPGLTTGQAQDLVNRAISAINEAARNYGSGKKAVNIGGQTFFVGRPAANIPSTQCQDFHSPEECLLLFNVCDPVICPISRCDLGGAYPVADVIQTGIVGSALLCLPNAREGIAVPVCLTGVKAGIDSYLSILKSHQACLQESIDTGRYVGTCDELTGIYMCEFFWRQVAPAANVVLPKLFEVATGQTAPRGGGEYNVVQSAWQNTEDSISYFTNSYAVNSLEAFKFRSVEEAGSEFCRAFVSAKAPKAFDSLIEPDSPVQFYARLDSKKFSDATVPATAHYKVFYHIFAGNDRGVSYSVYLKDAPSGSFYQIAPQLGVASGFVARGQFKTETRDFTAPEGYSQLCVRVNEKEECGFSVVTTDFAIDYLRDKVAADEISNRGITSENECISGSPNALTLISPNIQSGIEETAFPRIYERGVVRICATQNPGSETDPTRFADVGYCTDQKIRCWLDKKSIENSIEANNKYLKNKTLSEVESIQKQALLDKEIILPDNTLNEELRNYNARVKELAGSRESVKSEGEKLVGELENTFDKAVGNDHKAELKLLVARVYDRIASVFKGEVLPAEDPGATDNQVSTEEDRERIGLEVTPEDENALATQEKNLLKLEIDYKSGSDDKNKILLSQPGVGIDVYIKDDFVRKDGLIRDVEIGSVFNKVITIKPAFRKMQYYQQLNGARIYGSEIISPKFGLLFATDYLRAGVYAVSYRTGSGEDSSTRLVINLLTREITYNPIFGSEITVVGSVGVEDGVISIHEDERERQMLDGEFKLGELNGARMIRSGRNEYILIGKDEQ